MASSKFIGAFLGYYRKAIQNAASVERCGGQPNLGSKICRVSRMRDRQRRVTQITEVAGMEGIITTHDLFTYKFQDEGADGTLHGASEAAGIRPAFLPRAAYYGLNKTLLEAI
jgi:hypothetical protein